MPVAGVEDVQNSGCGFYGAKSWLHSRVGQPHPSVGLRDDAILGPAIANGLNLVRLLFNLGFIEQVNLPHYVRQC